MPPATRVTRGGNEREVIARAAYPDDVADLQLVVHIQSAAAAVRIAQNSEAPTVAVADFAAQRVPLGSGAVQN